MCAARRAAEKRARSATQSPWSRLPLTCVLCGGRALRLRAVEGRRVQATDRGDSLDVTSVGAHVLRRGAEAGAHGQGSKPWTHGVSKRQRERGPTEGPERRRAAARVA